jgi:hypothetical protein
LWAPGPGLEVKQRIHAVARTDFKECAMAQRVRKLVAVAGINGEIRPLEQLLEELPGRSADAIAVIGDLGAPWSNADTYRHNMEIAYPASARDARHVALAPGDLLFAGATRGSRSSAATSRPRRSSHERSSFAPVGSTTATTPSSNSVRVPVEAATLTPKAAVGG